MDVRQHKDLHSACSDRGELTGNALLIPPWDLELPEVDRPAAEGHGKGGVRASVTLRLGREGGQGVLERVNRHIKHQEDGKDEASCRVHPP
eukprot:670041-Hanusia_phi.AAC.1